MQQSELSKIMKENGIVGAGGAGFPSHKKLSDKADTIILNCAECEPLFKVHRQLLARYANEIMTALSYVKEAVGAKVVIIAVKPSYTDAIAEVEKRLEKYQGFRISLLPEIYPAGDEIITIYETTGKRIKPGKLPISEGVIVYNVETMLNTYYAVEKNIPVCYKYVTVTGEVKSPITVRVPIGTSFSQLVTLAGGETDGAHSYLSGGVMTGRLSTLSDSVTKTTNALLVLPENHPAILKRKTTVRVNVKRAMSACCQCRMCTDMCSRHMMGYPIEPHLIMRAAAKGMDSDINAVLNARYCSGCRLCELYSCQQGLSPVSLIGEIRSELQKQGVKAADNPEYTGIYENRELRKVPMERLTARLGVSKYEKSAPVSDNEIRAEKLEIKLSQHIGQKAKPIVTLGEKVEKYQKIAVCEDFGADIHSAACGTVKEISEEFIIIEKD